jgi:hypothetical protein
LGIPNQQNVDPRYQQITLNPEEKNRLQQILSPNPEDDGAWIHQDAWFHLGKFDNGFTVTYNLKRRKRCLCFHIIRTAKH